MRKNSDKADHRKHRLTAPAQITQSARRPWGGGGGGTNGNSGGAGASNGGGSTPGTSQTAGKQKRYSENPSGRPLATVDVGRPDYIPDIEWLPATEFDDPSLMARFEESRFRVVANSDCPILRETIDYWTNQYPLVSPDSVVRAVKRVYGLKLRSAVAHMLTARKRGTITSDKFDESTSPISLTTAVAGFVLEDVALAGDLGALDGKARRRAPARADT